MIRFSHILLISTLSIFVWSCEAIETNLFTNEGLVTITTNGWKMITPEPIPREATVVYFNEADEFVLQKKFFSTKDLDTLSNGNYSAYAYYCENNSMNIINLGDKKRTEFVVAQNEDNSINANDELYISGIENVKISPYTPATLNFSPLAYFTVMESYVTLTGKFTGITECTIAVDNAYSKFDLYSLKPVKGSAMLSKAQLSLKAQNSFYGRLYYLGFDPTNKNNIYITLKTATKTASVQFDATDIISRLTQKISFKVEIICDVDTDVAPNVFKIGLGQQEITDWTYIIAE